MDDRRRQPQQPLYRLGLTKESLPPGTEIAVEGYQAKDGSTEAVGRNIVFADGKKFFLGLTEAEGAPLSRIRVNSTAQRGFQRRRPTELRPIDRYVRS